jgi:hypothetical protein
MVPRSGYCIIATGGAPGDRAPPTTTRDALLLQAAREGVYFFRNIEK